MYRYFLASRFLVSRPINLLGILGVTLGVWALIVVVAIFDGYRVELRTQLALTSSDLVVNRIHGNAGFERVRAAIEADPNVAACSPRLVWMGLLHPRSEQELRTWLPGAIEKNGRFITITGIDPASEARTTGLDRWIADAGDAALANDLGSLHPDGDWILLSTRKAEATHVTAGDVVEVTTARVHFHSGGGTTDLLTSRFRVAGRYKSRHAGFDNLTAFAAIDTLRGLIAKTNPGMFNEVAIKLKSTRGSALEDTRIRLAGSLATLPDFARYDEDSRPVVRIATKDESGFVESIVHQAGLMKIVLFVIMVVAGFLCYATLSMMVTEKRHDIGVLSALGGTRTGVMQVFLTCGFAITLVGTIFGTTTGCLTSIYLNDFNEWLKRSFEIDLFPSDIYNLPGVPYYLDPGWIGIVDASSLVLGLLASGLPSYRAMRSDPLQYLRDQ